MDNIRVCPCMHGPGAARQDCPARTPAPTARRPGAAAARPPRAGDLAAARRARAAARARAAHCMPWSAAMAERTRNSSSGSISTLIVAVSTASSRTGNARCTLRRARPAHTWSSLPYPNPQV